MRSFLSLSHVLSGLLGGTAVVAGVLSFMFCHAEPAAPAPAASESDALAVLSARVATLEAQARGLEERAARTEPQIAALPVLPVRMYDLTPPARPELPESFDFAGVVRCSDEHQCEVSRDFVKLLLADPSKIVGQARIMPSVRDGEVRGYKMYGLRPGSLPKLLGFKNGDLVRAINGVPLTSAEHGLSVYTSLRTASQLTIEVERKGVALIKRVAIAP